MTAGLWGILWCSLLYGCATDLRSRKVYNFTWWFGGLAAGGLLWSYLYAGQGTVLLWHLTAYMILQFVVFARMYGRADCYAFCVCAIAEASLGREFTDYLVLMLLALCLLFPVQLLRRNIAKNGNLKQPVAFLPYISAAFALHLCLWQR